MTQPSWGAQSHPMITDVSWLVPLADEKQTAARLVSSPGLRCQASAGRLKSHFVVLAPIKLKAGFQESEVDSLKTGL